MYVDFPVCTVMYGPFPDLFLLDLGFFRDEIISDQVNLNRIGREYSGVVSIDMIGVSVI